MDIANYRTWGRRHENLQFIPGQSEVRVAWDSQLTFEAGVLFKDRAFNLWGLHELWAVSVRAELNLWTPRFDVEKLKIWLMSEKTLYESEDLDMYFGKYINQLTAEGKRKKNNHLCFLTKSNGADRILIKSMKVWFTEPA